MLEAEGVGVFSLFDFLNSCVDFFSHEGPFYLLYVESIHLVPIVTRVFGTEFIAETGYTGNTMAFPFQNSAMIFITKNPDSLLTGIREKLHSIYKKNPALRYAKVFVKTVSQHPSIHLQRAFKKIANTRRFIYVPNIHEYLKLLEHIDTGGREVAVDIKLENYPFFVNILSIISGRTCKVEIESGSCFLKMRKPEDSKYRKVLVKFRSSALGEKTFKLDSLSFEDAQKVLQSYFISPNISKALLETFYYRSAGSYQKMLEILDLAMVKGFVRWTLQRGWDVEHMAEDPFTVCFPPDCRELFETLSKIERIVLYTIVSSAHTLEKKDLLRAIPDLRIDELEYSIEKFEKLGIIKSKGSRVLSTHPAIDFNPQLRVSNRDFRRIHIFLAEDLGKRKMNGGSVPSWQIARHYELAGNTRSAVKYYMEAIEEDLKAKETEKAIKHATRTLKITRSTLKKLELKMLIANLYSQEGRYYDALECLNDLNDSRDLPSKVKKHIIIKQIHLQNQIGEINRARKMLQYLKNQSKKSSSDLFLEEFITRYNMDQLSPEYVERLRKISQKSSLVNDGALYYLMLGETEFYFNDTKKAVENYIKALKLSKNENISVLAELRLSEALLLTLRFRDALQHLERVLWITTNLNHEHIKSLVMEDVARIYLHILPPTSASMFLRFSMEDFLNGPVNQSYSYLYLLGLWYLKLGKTREGMQLLKLEIAREIGRGNRFKANNIALALVSELAKSGLLQEAGEILKNIKTRSPFLLNRKTLLETIMKLIQGKVLEFDLKTIEKMAEKNALNMLNFLELTENIKSPQLSALRERFNKDLVDLFSALRDIDLEGRL